MTSALTAVGLPADAPCEPTTGATGELFRVSVGASTYALRLVSAASAVVGVLATMDAARGAGLPVPALIRQADWTNGHALLFEWMSGLSVPEALTRDPSSAGEMGRQLGITQRHIHGITAPASLPRVKDDPFGPPTYPIDSSGLPDGDALLHLDWHPLNVLVDNGALTAVLDWDNARAGHPYADLARTHTLLTIDPALSQLSPVERKGVAELAAGWAAGYGPEASSIPASCLAWAGRAMLRDLAARCSAEELAPVRAWTAAHEAA
ncbi:phosphotransferase [Tenggerimyces flavus]|uniref:Phosphotransferase n=1 Tax=Tenggerimyces flavus TaxID=1708749 RepID=A0ABV7Y716_9ACTN|nr:phosphotransferase [Tenggerimyces flavus]MBM7788392.1 aminoglycoside phosphotransferase (APT) family kinase protein [Tenggerimyces flavus]